MFLTLVRLIKFSMVLTDMIQVSVKLDEKDVERIDRIAKKLGITRADVIRMVVKNWLEKGGEIKL